MKPNFSSLAVVALLAVGSALPGYAQDAPADPTAKTEAPPPSVARPSIIPKTAEPAAAPAPGAAADPEAKTAPDARPRHRHYAHRHFWWNGRYRTAYWEPFPIFWPHFYRNHLHWSRIPWVFRF